MQNKTQNKRQDKMQNKKVSSFCNCLGLFLVSVTAVVVFGGCSKQEASEPANTGNTAATDADVTVVKARFALRKDSKCSSDRLEEVTIKQSTAPPGAVHSASSIVGRLVMEEVPSGAIVRERDLVPAEKPADKPTEQPADKPAR